MKKTVFSLIFCSMAMGAFAQQPLGGFLYGTEVAPMGTEWEAPEKLSLNKEQPHAYFFSFNDVESALKVLSCWNVVGIQKDGSLKYGVPIYCNQPVIFKHTVAVGDWKGGVMREPNKDWTTYKYRNEVGSYRRTFTVADDWKDRQVYINFDGVNSFFYLWVNGQYVGFSKNSRNTASFDITKYLVKGENTVAGHHEIPGEGREHGGGRSVPKLGRFLPRGTGHVPLAGYLPEYVSDRHLEGAGARPEDRNRTERERSYGGCQGHAA